VSGIEMKLKEEIKRKTYHEIYTNSGQFCIFMKYSLNFWDQLEIFIKICGNERVDEGSLEQHTSRKFKINAYQDNEI
jgi:hypothetical protein